MHHTNTLHTTTARLMSLLCALCLLAACQKEEGPDLWIHTTGELSFRVDQNQNALQIPISSNSDWEASSSADWVSFDTTSGNGSATLQISIAANKQPQIRQATVSIALTKGDDVLTLEIKQNAASMLIGYPSVEKGAGYSYDATADYCEGMKYQVFDIAYMDYRQMTDGKNLYVVDDNTVTVEEEFVFANSEEELSRQISANCSVGLDVFVVFKAGMTGQLDYTQIEAKETQFALQRTKRVVYSRDIQYQNVVSDVIKGDSALFAPGFLADWTKLQKMNKTGVSESQIQTFLDKWGVCFVARSMMGGSIDYEMEIDKSVLTESLTIDIAASATAAEIIKVEGNGGYKETYEKVKEHYRKYLHVKGGDAQIVSILNTGGSIDQAMYNQWINSISFDQVYAGNTNVVLMDAKLVSMAKLFTGQVAETMDKLINKK